MSFEKISQDFSTDGNSFSHRQTFGQGGNKPAFPHHRLVILSLSLLNAVLLLAAVVIGIYCAKADDFQVTDSAISPLIIEMNHLRNHSGIIKDKLKAQAALVKERTNQVQIKLQVKQIKVQNEFLQRQIQTLTIEKTNLQSNKTVLEETCGRCPSGWILLKTSCYYFSRHEISSRKNWTESRKHCISQGGDLLVINSLEEQLFIIDNYQKVSSSGIWWQNGYWIGLTDVVTEGTWVWVNNVTEAETLYWRSGQPDRTGNERKNCAAFIYFTDTIKAWYNVDCNSQLLNWICEMAPEEITRG